MSKYDVEGEEHVYVCVFFADFCTNSTGRILYLQLLFHVFYVFVIVIVYILSCAFSFLAGRKRLATPRMTPPPLRYESLQYRTAPTPRNGKAASGRSSSA